eukprot:CAMPEP_0178549462 /NCGR_PEP_ID=MMETSP0697-20121206/5741_1 /TAXON_ID=265572 /ORGANISM="Extubocellulus spinifer, Strain CCMP396" /LENGTH=391 /DNA_ID=CAMNT_0020182203 /DNA_START=34 /DNA_END=1206 /DNA_ORIENTATION=+
MGKTSKRRTGGSKRKNAGGSTSGRASAPTNMAEAIMAASAGAGGISRLSGDHLATLCPGMPPNIARVLIPILADKTRKDRETERRNRIPAGAPGFDREMKVKAYTKQGSDLPMFGANLPVLPSTVTKSILAMLPIADVFDCYQASRAWVNDTVAVMTEKSQATENRFACGCAGLHPKILGKFVDLDIVTHAGGRTATAHDPMDVTLIPHLPGLRYFYDPRLECANLNNGEVVNGKLEGYCMRMLGNHCPLLEECDLGHQVWDNAFTTADVVTLLNGCPDLKELTSQNGFQLAWGDTNLLNALRSGTYTVCVPIGLRDPRRDMDVVIGSFVEDPGEFKGCLTTFPYCYCDPGGGLDEDDKRMIARTFDEESEDLMEKARKAGFSLVIDPMDW